ncbi:hypothetical protein P171DRAFT_245795 [Karstenula rhodostoma CBS 690.94]|uniref:Uncharacterized protein n=1 Tax=Karstenula rhodostoma CBS 690.94 TaxID=1392251 RepID=A0A9P4UCU2_9PLEO|nr:hypothetical protein P171DRAFT_245795 [Karstenula rhodostoma CBS 690.94]
MSLGARLLLRSLQDEPGCDLADPYCFPLSIAALCAFQARPHTPKATSIPPQALPAKATPPDETNHDTSLAACGVAETGQGASKTPRQHRNGRAANHTAYARLGVFACLLACLLRCRRRRKRSCATVSRLVLGLANARSPWPLRYGRARGKISRWAGMSEREGPRPPLGGRFLRARTHAIINTAGLAPLHRSRKDGGVYLRETRPNYRIPHE